MGKTKNVSAFERGMKVVGVLFCVKNCNAAGFFLTQQIPVCIKNVPPTKGHPANLTQLWEASESTWASIPVEHFQQSMP